MLTFPAHALSILEQRLAEQEDAGVKMPEGMERDQLGAPIQVSALGNRGISRAAGHGCPQLAESSGGES
jgi:hypothetical protein